MRAIPGDGQPERITSLSSDAERPAEAPAASDGLVLGDVVEPTLVRALEAAVGAREWERCAYIVAELVRRSRARQGEHAGGAGVVSLGPTSC